MRFAILGNSGSGKSTLADFLATLANLPSLDVDSVAWERDQPAVERSSAAAEADVVTFCSSHARWVLEGCYSNLVRASLRFRPHLIFLNPGLEACWANCRTRPWEPHKYPSKHDQDANLEFLISWVAEYYSREGSMSLGDHRALFDSSEGRVEAVWLGDVRRRGQHIDAGQVQPIPADQVFRELERWLKK